MFVVRKCADRRVVSDIVVAKHEHACAVLEMVSVSGLGQESTMHNQLLDKLEKEPSQ